MKNELKENILVFSNLFKYNIIVKYLLKTNLKKIFLFFQIYFKNFQIGHFIFQENVQKKYLQKTFKNFGIFLFLP